MDPGSLYEPEACTVCISDSVAEPTSLPSPFTGSWCRCGPLPLRLARFIGAEGVVRLGPLAAASLVATLPSLVFFSIIQGHLRSGLLAGGVKG